MSHDGYLEEAIAGLTKLALNARLFALLFTVVWLPWVTDDLTTVTVLLSVVAVTSLVPVLLWKRVAAWVLAHPAVLLVDLLVAGAVLALIGLDTPFGLFVLSTALIAGILYSWSGAAVMSVALIAAYLGGAILAQQQPATAELLGTPVLVPIAAVGGAGARRLVIRQHEASKQLAETSQRWATATERTRVAREMHDTLAKTLHGISMTATALPTLFATDPDRAADTARTLAAHAARAAEEARELIGDLRADDLDRSLAAVVDDTVEAWSRTSGTATQVDLAQVPAPSPSTRYELFCILREALRNVADHAAADEVTVTLRRIDLDDVSGSNGSAPTGSAPTGSVPTGGVRLTVADDGTGFAPPDDLADLTSEGHFGVVGMWERARSVGGDLRVHSAPGAGTRIEVEVPVASEGPPGLGGPASLGEPTGNGEATGLGEPAGNGEPAGLGEPAGHDRPAGHDGRGAALFDETGEWVP